MGNPPLKLVGPGVASGGESGERDAWDADGHSTWIDEFLGNCSDVVKECDPSLIEHLAMHDYWGDVDMLDRKLKGAFARYGRKIWLTEIAHTHWSKDPAEIPTRAM